MSVLIVTAPSSARVLAGSKCSRSVDNETSKKFQAPPIHIGEFLVTINRRLIRLKCHQPVIVLDLKEFYKVP